MINDDPNEDVELYFKKWSWSSMMSSIKDNNGCALNSSILDNILEPSILFLNSKIWNGKHGLRLKHISIPIMVVTKQHYIKFYIPNIWKNV